MAPRHFVIATAGHVDHGKSALVKTLTGTDPDRLPEEKLRGITIDLGFAELRLQENTPEEIHAGIIDVPGHEGFVRNMIAGVGSIDLAILVVAADDGWMPQTEEHFQILEYLGVERIVVAITKADATSPTDTEAQVQQELAGTRFSRATIVPTSVQTGEGLDDLKRAIVTELRDVEPERDMGKPRLYVDRAFTLHGIGTVVTGTLTGGELHRGQSVIVQPAGHSSRVRSIQNHGRESDVAVPGMRTAINLSDLAVSESNESVERGDVIALADYPPVDVIDVLLEKSPRLGKHKSTASRPIKTGSAVFLHHGTGRTVAKVSLWKSDALDVGEREVARLRLSAPILAFLGDRFVLRDPTNRYTIAGGIVLDANGDTDGMRNAAQLQMLTQRAAGPDDLLTAVSTEIARKHVVAIPTLLRKSRFSHERIGAAVSRLSASGDVMVRGELAVDTKSWKKWRAELCAAIDEHHVAQPASIGKELRELRSLWGNRPAEVFDVLVSDLTRDEFIQDSSTLRRAVHRPSLPPHLSQAASKIITALQQKPVDPPSRKEFSTDPHAREAMTFLRQKGEIVEVSDDVLLLRTTFDEMKQQIVSFISQSGPATVSDLRKHLGTSRRVLVPLLEKLDRERVTSRRGDCRALAH